MGKLLAPFSILIGAAVWFLLFVILGIGLGTSFIAGGCVVAAGFVATAMILAGPVIDTPLTATGLLLGIATFVIMRVVLSVPLWVDIVSGLGVMGLYDIVDAAVRPRAAAAVTQETAVEPRGGFVPSARTRGNHSQREPVEAR